MTRALYNPVNQKLYWNFKVVLTKEACDELKFISYVTMTVDFFFTVKAVASVAGQIISFALV